MNLETYIETLPNGFTFPMRLIPGGSFDMGSRDDDPEAIIIEKPQRKNVQVEAFYMAPFQATQALWEAVMGHGQNPSHFLGDNRPVESVSWFDTLDFIKQLNILTEASRAIKGVGKYRLPTEAEWEYAARGGNLNAQYQYAGSDKLKEVGWFRKNSDGETHEVGKLMPNSLNLFDMSGNVWEWITRHWPSFYPSAPDEGKLENDEDYDLHVLRGGSYVSQYWYCRVAFFNYGKHTHHDNDIGFRLALSN